MKNYYLLFLIAVIVSCCYREDLFLNPKYSEVKKEVSDTSVVLKLKQPGTDYMKYKEVELESVSDTVLIVANKNFNFLEKQSRLLNLRLDKYLKKKYNYPNKTKVDTVNINQPKTCNRPKPDLGMIQDSSLMLYYNL